MKRNEYGWCDDGQFRCADNCLGSRRPHAKGACDDARARDSRMKTAYIAVKHMWTLVHKYEYDPLDGIEGAVWHLTENKCSLNALNQLQDLQEEGYCNACAFHSAEHVGTYDSLDALEDVGLLSALPLSDKPRAS